MLNDIPYIGYVIKSEGIKPDPKKVQGIMDLGITDTTTEARALICMVQYYKDMCTRCSHILATRTEAAIEPKDKKILCNDALETYFKELNYMVSSEMLLSYPYWTLTFTVHTDASNKKLGAVISQNNKTISFFPKILIKPHHN